MSEKVRTPAVRASEILERVSRDMGLDSRGLAERYAASESEIAGLLSGQRSAVSAHLIQKLCEVEGVLVDSFYE